MHVKHIDTYICKRLFIACLLTSAFFVVEAVAAYLTGSMTLASDAGHMFVDVLGLFTAFFAAVVVSRPNKNVSRTYGWYRVEVFSAGIGVIIMLCLAGFMAYEAVMRFLKPDLNEHVSHGSLTMFLVGLLGLVVNFVVILVLHKKRRENINLQAAYLEVLSDALGSVGVIFAAALIAVTGLTIFDTVIALIIIVFILLRALKLGKKVIRILLQAAPEGVDVKEVKSSLLTVDGVVDVRHLHVWTLSSEAHIATANLIVAGQRESYQVLLQAEELLHRKYNIHHTTIQITPTSSGIPCCQSRSDAY